MYGAGCLVRTDDLSLTRRLHYRCANPAGIPQETRTLTNGFGDRRAAITLGRNKMDRPEELESPTFQFVAECSNPLS